MLPECLLLLRIWWAKTSIRFALETPAEAGFENKMGQQLFTQSVFRRLDEIKTLALLHLAGAWLSKTRHCVRNREAMKPPWCSLELGQMAPVSLKKLYFAFLLPSQKGSAVTLWQNHTPQSNNSRRFMRNWHLLLKSGRTSLGSEVFIGL